jgi:hypothetical protein
MLENVFLIKLTHVLLVKHKHFVNKLIDGLTKNYVNGMVLLAELMVLIVIELLKMANIAGKPAIAIADIHAA